MLRKAGVSRNAYYSLLRRRSVLPASLEAVADALGVPASELVAAVPSASTRARELAREVARIVGTCPEADPDNVRHALVLLEEPPLSRLRRALRRGRRVHIQS